VNVFALKINNKLDDSVLKGLLALLDHKKRERLLRFVFWQDLHRSLFADLLVRKIIIDTFNLSNEKIYFSVNEYDKPYCEFLDDFHFNISHSGNWVVCAVDKKPIGIDIEETSTCIDLSISENFFSNKEHADLLLSNDPYDYFFTLWSLKESYIKFLGKGLSHPLNTFSMKLNNSKIYIESYNKILEDIYFKQYNIDKEYKMAVCSLNPDIPEKVIKCSVSEVIKPFINLEIEI